ncbi:MAG: DUF2824 family protein [Alteromonadales bacterium]|nr:DUF2824 family protein [Alteromonadales bacterium]
MIIERTYDKKIIGDVVSDSLNDLLQDGETEGDCYFDVERDCYLALYDDNLIGVYQLRPINRTVIDLHPIMLRKHRDRSNESIKEVFKWIVDNCAKTVNKVIAQFPSNRIHIEKFALRAGFKKEGINRESFLLNGKYLDQTMVGITMNEIKEALL